MTAVIAIVVAINATVAAINVTVAAINATKEARQSAVGAIKVDDGLTRAELLAVPVQPGGDAVDYGMGSGR